MGRSSAPPLDGDVILRARLGKFMTQDDVIRGCAERGFDLGQGTLSKIENGRIRWPAIRLIPILADVLGIDASRMFADEDEAAA